MTTTAVPTDTQPPAPDLGLQSHFWAPPESPPTPSSPPPPRPSLVSTTDNSADAEPSGCKPNYCPSARFVRGYCAEHGNVHWLLVPCRRRSCDICGPVSRYKIACRIAYGVRKLWPAAWIVLTFDHEVDKVTAIRKMAAFIRSIRKLPGHENTEYAATYELTRAGRLHINLIVAPWRSIPQRLLSDKWGARLWIEWVKNDESLGVEAAAAYTPEALGGYIAKLDQAVREGKRVTYSKRWPQLPDPAPTRHKIIYEHLSDDDQLRVWALLRRGWLTEVSPGVYRLARSRPGRTPCDCFDRQLALPSASDPPPQGKPP